MSNREPCMCGDPECGACFPQHHEIDADEFYDDIRQRELDDKFDE